MKKLVKNAAKTTKAAKKTACGCAPADLNGQLVGKLCVFRTYSAGVHIGVLALRNGTEALVKDSRRLWKWQGAFTLNEVASLGVTRSGSRISKHVPEILLTQVIEIVPVAAGVDLSTTEA